MPPSRGRGTLVTYLYFTVILHNREEVYTRQNSPEFLSLIAKCDFTVGKWCLWRRGRDSDVTDECLSIVSRQKNRIARQQRQKTYRASHRRPPGAQGSEST